MQKIFFPAPWRAMKAAPPVRVLVRPPSAPRNATGSQSDAPTADSSAKSGSPPENGVAVVGFVGPEDEVRLLINRIVDSRVFGGGGEKDILSDGFEEWFLHRRIRYYHQVERGTVFLQFSSDSSARPWRGGDGKLDSRLEQRDYEDLRGFLLMFSVCHVIIFLHEAARFDTNMLKKFRMLQSAKHTLTTSMRAKITSTAARKTSPSNTRTPVQTNSSGIRRGFSSPSSMLPGHSIPVILFIFLDDYSSFTATEDPSATPTLAPRSGSIVVLSHPVNKAEISLKKKLQTSLESQIRFLIKKFRVVSSADSTSRSIPLFSLDSSRVSVLLDRSSLRPAESLDYITYLIENSDLNSSSEDIQSVTDFISRQMDALRGRGSIPSSGSMVAAAAAAAAASASSGKVVNTPELPSLENWLSSSRNILEELLSARRSEAISIMDSTVSLLEAGKDLNMRFSTAWCHRALPAAKEIYLTDLPSRYPAIIHSTRLEKAREAFCGMVKGPAVKIFVKKLEEECEAIWESGRQLCDVISLTGLPCQHEMHHLTSVDFKGRERKHSSGFVFLHACACGRSRSLREDPFDFKEANIDFNSFPACESQLPRLSLPSSPWIVIRLGGASYYNPSKGLVQSGFCQNENFLLEWILAGDKCGENEVRIESGIPAGTVVSFGKGLPSLLTKKPFSEVVAGSSQSKVNDKAAVDSESMKNVGRRNKIYFGFEHECPSGHRFILSGDHLKVMGQDLDLSGERGDWPNEYPALLSKNLPVYMKCPHCRDVRDGGKRNYKASSGISQLQRIFLVTPPFPFVFSTCPVIRFEDSCLPASLTERDQQSTFSPGPPIILPPDSFISLRLPFIYAVRSQGGTMEPLRPLHDPELTASLSSGSALHLLSKAIDFLDP